MNSAGLREGTNHHKTKPPASCKELGTKMHLARTHVSSAAQGKW
jgi:hypothetical protein